MHAISDDTFVVPVIDFRRRSGDGPLKSFIFFHLLPSSFHYHPMPHPPPQNHKTIIQACDYDEQLFVVVVVVVVVVVKQSVEFCCMFL